MFGLQMHSDIIMLSLLLSLFCVLSLSIIFFSGSTFMDQFILQWSDFNLKQWN